MAKSFNLTAELNLRGPANIRTVVADIRRQIGTINVSINPQISSSASRNIAQLNNSLQNLNSTFNATRISASNTATAIRDLSQAMSSVGANNIQRTLNNAAGACQNLGRSAGGAGGDIGGASTRMEEFGRQSALAVRRFAAFSIVTKVIFSFTNAIDKGVRAFIEFDKEFVRLQQVTGESSKGLQSLAKEISNLSINLGVASSDLTNVAVTLAQAGLSATDTKKALKALALSSLAPSFDDMNETVEGSIALMRQFGISAGDLQAALGSINAVAAKFAVEASDIITAIQRTGGVFATASKGVSEGTDALNEFISVFTSVRATTRESAETIATGLRTIFTRIQRGGTIEALKEYGVELTDLEGKFVGPFEAVRRLSEGLSKLDPRDIRFSQIVEELGGFRQIGKVIPLIQQFATAQEALKVAQKGQASLAEDAAIAQLSIANQLAKVREEFTALIRSIGQSESFRSFVTLSLQLASALIKVADAAKGVLPAIAALAAIRGTSALFQFGTGFSRQFGNVGTARGGRRFASGGLVPGSGNGDTVPAMLTPGEFVIRKKAVESIGAHRLQGINRYASGGRIQKFAQKQVKLNSGLVKDVKNAGGFEQLINRNMIGPDGTYNFGLVSLRSGTKQGSRIVENRDIGNTGKKARIHIGTLSDKAEYSNIEKDITSSLKRTISRTGKSLASSIGGSTVDKSSRKQILSGAVLSSATGSIFEAALQMIGAPFIDKIESIKSIDFPFGLGSASSLFGSGFPSNIPTDATRTIGGSGKGISDFLSQINRFVKATESGKFTRELGPQAGTLSGQMSSRLISKVKNDQQREQVNNILRKYGIPNFTRKPRSNFKDILGKRLTQPAIDELKLAGYASGGNINGQDSVPALLTPGEFVINKKAASRLGSANLNSLNRADKIQGYNSGGYVGNVQRFAMGGFGFPRTGTGSARPGGSRAGIRDFTNQGASVRGRGGLGGGLISTGLLIGGGAAIEYGTQGLAATGLVSEGTAAGIGNVASSTLSMGATGASIGSIFGPWGTAIGGAAGALAGFATGIINYTKVVNETEAELTQAKLEAQQEKTSQALGAFAKTGAGRAEAVTSIQDLAALEQKRISKDKTLTSAQIAKINIEGASAAVKFLETSMIKSGKNFDEISQVIGADTFKFLQQQIAEADISYVETINKLTEELNKAKASGDPNQIKKAQDNLDKEQKKLLDSVSKQALSATIASQQQQPINKKIENIIDRYNRIQSSLERFGNDTESIRDSILNNLKDIEGNAQISNINRTNEQILANVRGYSTQEVSGVAGTVQNIVGGKAGQDLASSINTAKILQDVLPSILTNANDSSEVIKQLKEVAPDISENTIKEITDALRATVSKNEGKSFREIAQDPALLADLTKTTEKAFETASLVLKKYNDSLQAVTDLQNQYVDTISKANEYTRKASEIRLNSELELKRTLGKTISLQEMNAPFEANIKALTSNVVPGGTTDPNAIYNAIVDAQKEAKKLEQDRKSLTKDSDEKALKANADALNNNRLKLNNATNALKILADNGVRTANVLSKIQEKSQRLAAVADSIENILTATPDDLAKFNEQAQAFVESTTAGPEFFQSTRNRQMSFAGLNQFKDILDPAKFRQLRADLIERSLTGLGVDLNQQLPGIGMSMKEMLENARTGELPQNDPLIAEYRKLVNDAATANTILSQLMLDQASNIDDGIQKLLDRLATELPGIIGKAFRNPQAKSNGGLIYASGGQHVNFKPKGTDTVPAMLTPGEFVVNARATSKHLPLLEAINDGGKSSGYSNGGMVYLADGGQLTYREREELRRQQYRERQAQLKAKQDAYARSRVGPRKPIVQYSRDRTIYGEAVANEMQGKTPEERKLIAQRALGHQNYRTFKGRVEKYRKIEVEDRARGDRLYKKYGDFNGPDSDREAEFRLPAKDRQLLDQARQRAEEARFEESIRVAEVQGRDRAERRVDDAGVQAGRLVDQEREQRAAAVQREEERRRLLPPLRPLPLRAMRQDVDNVSINFDDSSIRDANIRADAMEKMERDLYNESTRSTFVLPETDPKAAFLARIKNNPELLNQIPSGPGAPLQINGSSIGADLTSSAERAALEERARIDRLANEPGFKGFESAVQKANRRVPDSTPGLDAPFYPRLLAAIEIGALAGGALAGAATSRGGTRPPSAPRARVSPKPIPRNTSTRSTGRSTRPNPFDLGVVEFLDSGAGQLPASSARSSSVPVRVQQSSASPKGTGSKTVPIEDVTRPLTSNQELRLQELKAESEKNLSEAKTRAESTTRSREQDAIKARVRAATKRGEEQATRFKAMGLEPPNFSSIQLATGGIVYASRGMTIPYQSRGTDTVPAMLTPGEFVVNKQATSSNLSLLQSLNRGGKVNYYQNGGNVGTTNRGPVGTTISLDSNAQKFLDNLTNTFNSFDSYVTKLERVASTIPNSIELTGNYQLNVNITGAAAFDGLSKEMQRIAVSLVEPKLQELRDEVSAVTGGAVRSSAAKGKR